MDKKAQMQGGTTIIVWVIIFAVIAIASAVTVSLIQDVQTDQVAGSVGYNVSQNLLDAADNLTKRTPLLGTAVIFGVILFVVIGFLGVLAYTRRQ